MKILIVEDNELNQKLFNDLLLASGYDVLITDDGLAVAELARKFVPDLFIVDIQLPRISGIGVLALIKADRKLSAIPAIACTAYAMKGDKERMLNAGFTAYITKPISVPNFLKTVAYFTNHTSSENPPFDPAREVFLYEIGGRYKRMNATEACVYGSKRVKFHNPLNGAISYFLSLEGTDWTYCVSSGCRGYRQRGKTPLAFGSVREALNAGHRPCGLCCRRQLLSWRAAEKDSGLGVGEADMRIASEALQIDERFSGERFSVLSFRSSCSYNRKGLQYIKRKTFDGAAAFVEPAYPKTLRRLFRKGFSIDNIEHSRSNDLRIA
jgi:two-component system cell cycle response regulator DivK